METGQPDLDLAIRELRPGYVRTGERVVDTARRGRQPDFGADRPQSRNILDHFHNAAGAIILTDILATHLRRSIEQMEDVPVFPRLMGQCRPAGGG